LMAAVGNYEQHFEPVGLPDESIRNARYDGELDCAFSVAWRRSSLLQLQFWHGLPWTRSTWFVGEAGDMTGSSNLTSKPYSTRLTTSFFFEPSANIAGRHGSFCTSKDG
jgi:hypothetical protein